MMELNIYFKNVGQGDTIILDWKEEDCAKRKYALIDCNLVNNRIDYIVDHIESKNHIIKKFEFVVMSHPHSDHFSGFMKFLDYCEQNSIYIKKFLHTSAFDPTFLSQLLNKTVTNQEFEETVTASVNRRKHKEILWQLYWRLEQMQTDPNSIIGEVFIINNDYPISLTKEVILKFLAPHGYDEVKKYIQKTFDRNSNESKTFRLKYENNPYANYLSSLLQISCTKQDWQVLLCSDITFYTLEKIKKKEQIYAELINTKLLAVQIPHHGSKENHDENFWNQIKKLDQAHIIISVGTGYGHPNIDVIKFFADKAKSVHATNFVGGYRDFYAGKVRSDYQSKIIQEISLPDIGFNEQANIHDIKCCEKHLRIVTDNEEIKNCVVMDC